MNQVFSKALDTTDTVAVFTFNMGHGGLDA